MGEPEQPPGSISDTDELTARTTVSPQLFALAKGEMDPVAMEKQDGLEPTSGTNSTLDDGSADAPVALPSASKPAIPGQPESESSTASLASSDETSEPPSDLASDESLETNGMSAELDARRDSAPLQRIANPTLVGIGHLGGLGSPNFGIAALGAAPMGIAPLGAPGAQSFALPPLSPLPAASPLEASPLEALPLEASPLEASPLEASPIEAPPIEAPPLEALPIEAPPIEAPPIEAPPIEASPLEASPLEALPIEALPIEALPLEASPIEALPIEALPLEALPIEALPIEALPIEALPIEASPIEASEASHEESVTKVLPRPIPSSRVQDEPPPDSGWGSARPPSIAAIAPSEEPEASPIGVTASSEALDSVTTPSTASGEAPGSAAPVLFAPETPTVGTDEPPETVPSVARDLSLEAAAHTSASDSPGLVPATSVLSDGTSERGIETTRMVSEVTEIDRAGDASASNDVNPSHHAATATMTNERQTPVVADSAAALVAEPSQAGAVDGAQLPGMTALIETATPNDAEGLERVVGDTFPTPELALSDNSPLKVVETSPPSDAPKTEETRPIPEPPAPIRSTLRSKPPPRQTGQATERPPILPLVVPAPVPAPSPTVPSEPVTAIPTTEPPFSSRLQLSSVLKVAWGVSIAAGIALGWSVRGASTNSKLAAASASASSAVQAARALAIAETQAQAPKRPDYLDLSRPNGIRSMVDIIKSEPTKRTRAEALALGRQWQEKRLDEYNQFANELRRTPQKLEESKTKNQTLDFIHDRLTSRATLELLSELASPKALDLLYAVWIGSKDRNETTQLAEALLLAQDVRKHASGALELALALREKPTACEDVQKLVDRAIREGDRRSANQLVTTAARQNCGPNGSEDCVKCLSDVKDMRRAIRASAARADPVP